jgi:hypothetical protein
VGALTKYRYLGFRLLLSRTLRLAFRRQHALSTEDMAAESASSGAVVIIVAG